MTNKCKHQSPRSNQRNMHERKWTKLSHPRTSHLSNESNSQTNDRSSRSVIRSNRSSTIHERFVLLGGCVRYGDSYEERARSWILDSIWWMDVGDLQKTFHVTSPRVENEPGHEGITLLLPVVVSTREKQRERERELNHRLLFFACSQLVYRTEPKSKSAASVASCRSLASVDTSGCTRCDWVVCSWNRGPKEPSPRAREVVESRCRDEPAPFSQGDVPLTASRVAEGREVR